MSGRLRVNENSRPHWALYALIRWDEENDDRKVTSKQLFLFSKPAFDDVGGVSKGLSTLADRNLVSREESDENRYRYWINENGKRTLYKLGVPDMWPASDEEVDHDLPDLPERKIKLDLKLDEAKEKADERESAGPFPSDAARRAFFAQKEQEKFEQFCEQKKAEQLDRYEGEETVEGVDEVFTDDEDAEMEVGRSDMVELEEGRGVEHEEPLPDTVSLEPDWEFLAVELANRGLIGLATKALNEELSPMVAFFDVEDILREIDPIHNFSFEELLDHFEFHDEEGNEITGEEREAIKQKKLEEARA